MSQSASARFLFFLHCCRPEKDVILGRVQFRKSLCKPEFLFMAITKIRKVQQLPQPAACSGYHCIPCHTCLITRRTSKPSTLRRSCHFFQALGLGLIALCSGIEKIFNCFQGLRLGLIALCALLPHSWSLSNQHIHKMMPNTSNAQSALLYAGMRWLKLPVPHQAGPPSAPSSLFTTSSLPACLRS